MRQKLIIMPKLNDCGGKISRQWFVYYSCRNPKTGKMERFRHYDGFKELSSHDRYKYAEKLIDLYTRRLQAGWSPFGDSTKAIYDDQIEYKTVAEIYGTRRNKNNLVRSFISEYLEYVKPGVRYSTYCTYKSKLRIFALWLERENISKNDISSIDNKAINSFFQFLITDRKLSAKSLRKYWELIRKFFDHLKNRKLLFENPVGQMPACNRINDHTARPIMRADIEKFKTELIKDPELWLAVQFEFYCGLRPGHEMREMKIKDIDLVAGTIYVTRERAKNWHERVVTIPYQFLQQLRDQYCLQDQDREYYVFGRDGRPGSLVIGKNKLNYKFNKIRDRLKMPKEYQLYSWKHTGAIEADLANIPSKDISIHLGHSSLQITDIYFRNKKPGVSEAIRDNYPSL
ncbi:MAG TPA: site-specific integrase [Candidatus Cloacimonadota bacterium]|nr:site-specific integrase [Candidatus Cloacimonadota bacterium]